MSEHGCITEKRLDPGDFERNWLGIDRTDCRYGEVTILTCKVCGQHALRYFVEYEEFSRSGRYFIGAISADAARQVTSETAVETLDRLDWHFNGGSNFGGGRYRSTGEIKVDAF